MASNEDAAEAQRLVGDSQPEDNRIEQISIGRKIAFHNLHIAVALGSIAFFLYDVAIDYYAAYGFYSANRHWYAAFAVTFLVLPALLMSCLSGWWYFCGEQRRQCFPSAMRAVWMFRIACHACFLSPLARLVDSLRCGLKCKSALKEKNVDKFRKYDALLVYEDRDATFLRLLGIYLGMAPQVLVRLTAVAQGAFAADREEMAPLWQHAVIAVGSVSSLAWATVAYKVTSDLAQQDNRQRTDWPKKFIYGLAHFFLACARFIALAIGAAFLPRTFWIGVALHFIAMFVYVRWYHRKEMPANPFSWPKDSIRDYAAYVFLAVVHVFTFFNLNHYRTTARYLLYFTLCFLENTVLMTCWWFLHVEADARDLVHCVLLWTQMGAFVLGLSLLWYSHRSRLARHKAIPHESQANGLTNEETPLRQDNKEEVCQEVVVVEEASNQQELDLQESAPAVVVHETGIETDDSERIENLQSGIVNEEPIKEKVIEIWFNRAPKSADETSTDNSVKSGQHETEDGHNLPCVTEVVMKKASASIETAKRQSSPDIATTLGAVQVESSAVSQDIESLKRDSEIRQDQPTANSPTALESVGAKVEQAKQESAGLYEDVEKLLMELNAYEAGIEQPQVPKEESIVQTQQAADAGQPEQTEKSESLMPAVPASVQQAASIPKQVFEEPQEKTKEESNVDLGAGEPIGHAEEKIIFETHNQQAEQLNDSCDLAAADSPENDDSHSNNLAVIEEAEFLKSTEDESVETPLPPKVESVSMRSEECHQPAESEPQLGEAEKTSVESEGLDAPGADAVEAIETTVDQAHNEVVIPEEAIEQDSQENDVFVEQVDSSVVTFKNEELLVEDPPPESVENSSDNDTQFMVLTPTETGQIIQPDDEVMAETTETESHQDEVQNLEVVVLDSTPVINDASLEESTDVQNETLPSVQLDNAEQNFSFSEKPQNDENVSASIQEVATDEMQDSIQADEPEPPTCEESSSELEPATTVADVCEPVVPVGTDSSPDQSSLQSDSLDSQEKPNEAILHSEIPILEPEKEGCESVEASIHEADANQAQSESQPLEEEAPVEQTELIVNPEQSEHNECDLQPVEIVSVQEPESSAVEMIAEGENLSATPNQENELDTHDIGNEHEKQTNQDTVADINPTDLGSDQISDEKLTSDEINVPSVQEDDAPLAAEPLQQVTPLAVENESSEMPTLWAAQELTAPLVSNSEINQTNSAMDTPQLPENIEDCDEKLATSNEDTSAKLEPDAIPEVDSLQQITAQAPAENQDTEKTQVFQPTEEQAATTVVASDCQVEESNNADENLLAIPPPAEISVLPSDSSQLAHTETKQLSDESTASGEDLSTAQEISDDVISEIDSLHQTTQVPYQESEPPAVQPVNELTVSGSDNQVEESAVTDEKSLAAFPHSEIKKDALASDTPQTTDDQPNDEKLAESEKSTAPQADQFVIPAAELLLETTKELVDSESSETPSIQAIIEHQAPPADNDASDSQVNDESISSENLSIATHSENGQSTLASDTPKLFDEENQQVDDKISNTEDLPTAAQVNSADGISEIDSPQQTTEVLIEDQESKPPAVQPTLELVASEMCASQAEESDVTEEKVFAPSEANQDDFASIKEPPAVDFIQDQSNDENLTLSETFSTTPEDHIIIPATESLQETTQQLVESETNERSSVQAINEEIPVVVSDASDCQVNDESNVSNENLSTATHPENSQSGFVTDKPTLSENEDNLLDVTISSTVDSSTAQVESDKIFSEVDSLQKTNQVVKENLDGNERATIQEKCDALPANESLQQMTQSPVESQADPRHDDGKITCVQATQELATPAVRASDNKSEISQEIPLEVTQPSPDALESMSSSESIERSEDTNPASAIVINQELSSMENKVTYAEGFTEGLQMVAQSDAAETTGNHTETSFKIDGVQNGVQKENVIASPATAKEKLYVGSTADCEPAIEAAVEDKSSAGKEELLDETASQDGKNSEETAAITCDDGVTEDLLDGPQDISVQDRLITSPTPDSSVSNELNNAKMSGSTVDPKAVSSDKDSFTSAKPDIIQDSTLEAILQDEGNSLANNISTSVEDSREPTSPNVTEPPTTNEPEKSQNVQLNCSMSNNRSDSDVNSSTPEMERINMQEGDVNNEKVEITDFTSIVDLEKLTLSDCVTSSDLTPRENEENNFLAVAAATSLQIGNYVAEGNTIEDKDEEFTKALEYASREVPDVDLSFPLKETIEDTSANNLPVTLSKGNERDATENWSPAASQTEKRPIFQSKIPRKKP